jgi:hypothetical protein
MRPTLLNSKKTGPAGIAIGAARALTLQTVPSSMESNFCCIAYSLISFGIGKQLVESGFADRVA